MVNDCLESRLSVLKQLWTVLGKRVTQKRLMRYEKSFEGVPIELLELAVSRVIKDNTGGMAPGEAVIGAAVRKELGYPDDKEMAIREWEKQNRIKKDCLLTRSFGDGPNHNA